MNCIVRRLITATLLIISSLLVSCDDAPNQSKESNKKSELISKESANRESKKINADSSSIIPNKNISTDVDDTQLSTSPENTNETLIEEMGFSGAQDGDLKLKKQSKYCLGSTKTSKPAISSNAICEKISNRLASISMQNCLDAKLKESGCHSVKEFPILVRDFPPLSNKPPQGRILIIGGTHADELTSVSMVFRWIATLNKNHSGLFHWHVIPIMNPDGLFKKSATRTNDNGVDLNRNMPSDDWDENALHYWETKGEKNPRRFPGNKASSEPETQWLIDEINDFKPDAIISVHAPYGIVDFDSLLLSSAPKSLGKLHLNLLGTYPGSLGNYAGINLNIPVITLELPHAWEMPSNTETAKIWRDIVNWLKDNIDKTQN